MGDGAVAARARRRMGCRTCIHRKLLGVSRNAIYKPELKQGRAALTAVPEQSDHRC